METLLGDAPNQEDFFTELSDLNDIELPYILKNKIIFSPGMHNGKEYGQEIIHRAFANTEWNQRTRSLYLDHNDEFATKVNAMTGKPEPVHVGASVYDWVGEVKNLKFRDGTLRGDLYVVDKPTAIKLAYGAKFGVSPRGKGKAHQGSDTITDMLIENFSIVVNPAIKSTYLNMEIEELNEEVNNMDVDKLKEDITSELKETLSGAVKEAVIEELKCKYPEEKKKGEYPEAKLEDDFKALVKKYGIAEAKKIMDKAKKEGNTNKMTEEETPQETPTEEPSASPVEEPKPEEQPAEETKEAATEEETQPEEQAGDKDTEVEQLKERIKLLEGKLDEPEEKSERRKTTSTESLKGGAEKVEEMSERELDIRFAGYLQELNGMKVTALDQLTSDSGGI